MLIFLKTDFEFEYKLIIFHELFFILRKFLLKINIDTLYSLFFKSTIIRTNMQI